MDEKEKQASVPYFIHEGVMTRMERVIETMKESGADSMGKMKEAVQEMSENNKRMLSALRTVCIALVLAVIVFVIGYTINNNSWIRYVEGLHTEVTDAGVYEQPDTGADQ